MQNHAYRIRLPQMDRLDWLCPIRLDPQQTMQGTIREKQGGQGRVAMRQQIEWVKA